MQLPERKVVFRMWLSALFVCVAALPLTAQSASQSTAQAGSLIYASGSGFEVVRDGQQEEYDLSTDIVEGLEFYAGDYVNTFEETFLEVQVRESSHLLKISENTSFRFGQSTQNDASRYEVTYGRVRARVRKMAGLERFSISGPSMVAGVRGTDFGYDVLYDVEEQTTVSSVYCFEGEVEVEPTVEVIEAAEEGDPAAGGVPKKLAPILIAADDMVQVRELSDRQLYVLRRAAVEEEIRTYWEENDFKADPVEAESGVEMKQKTRTESETPAPPPGLQFRFTQSQLRRGSLLTAGIGTVFGTAALTFAFADPLLGDMDPAVRENLTLSMGISAGLFFSTSLFTLIVSFF